MSQADISTEVGITGWNSVSCHLLPELLLWLHPPKWAGGGSTSAFPCTAAQSPWLEAGTGALLVPTRCLSEHRSSQQRGLAANAVGQLCKGWGTAVTTKLWVLSPHTHTEIVHSNQCGRKCLQDLSWELLIINNSWIARRALAVILWVGKPLWCSQWQHCLRSKAVH